MYEYALRAIDCPRALAIQSVHPTTFRPGEPGAHWWPVRSELANLLLRGV